MRTTRIISAVGVAVATAVLLPTQASAAPPTHTVNTVKELTCLFGTTTGEGAAFQASSSSDDGSSGASFFVEDEDFQTVLEGGQGTATFGSRFSASIAAVEPSSGRTVGTATLTAALAEGAPVVEQVDERDGNIRTTGTITTSEYTFTDVSAALPGYSLVPGDFACSGSTTVFDVNTTNPPVHVLTTRAFDSDPCTVAGIAHAQVRLSGETRRAPHVDVVIDDGTTVLRARGDVAMRGTRGSLTTPLEDFDGDTVAQVTLGLGLTRAQRSSTSVDREGKTITIRTETPYRAEITAATSDGRRGRTVCPAEQVVETTLTFRR